MRGDAPSGEMLQAASASCFLTFWPRHAETKTAFVPCDVAKARADVSGQHLGQISAQRFGCFIGVAIQHCQQDLVPTGLDLLHHLQGTRLQTPSMVLLQ